MAAQGDVHFLTGFPGFLAGRLLRRILELDRKARVIALVQPRWLREANRERDALEPRQRARVELLVGDVVDMHLGLAGGEYRSLAERLTFVHHLAQATNLGADRTTLERVNVDGTRNVLELCRDAKGLRRLSHVSTVHVAGDRHGVIEEEELEEGQRFHDAYEETKFKAEVLVKKASRDLPLSIFRPSTIVGDSRTGEIDRFEGPYHLAFRLVTSPLRVPLPLPDDGSFPLHVVPADWVVDAILRLSADPGAVGKTFHLVDPGPMSVRKVYEYIARKVNRRPPRVGLPAKGAAALLRLPLLEKLTRPQRTALEHLTTVAIYSSRNTLELLDGTGIRCPPLLSYLDRLIAYVQEQDRRVREARAAERIGAEDPLAPPAPTVEAKAAPARAATPAGKAAASGAPAPKAARRKPAADRRATGGS